MLMKQMRNGNVASKQQENRETGFRHYMHDHFPKVKIHEVNLSLDDKPEQYEKVLEKFFSEHQQVHHCITFNSRAYLVGEFLLKSNRRNVQIMGYDMVPRNAECVRQSSISFLIAQHAYMQGYACIQTLFDAIVLKKEVDPVNYMPIELLTRENIDFYRRKNIG
jgi:LacI family transcriptional regulator